MFLGIERRWRGTGLGRYSCYILIGHSWHGHLGEDLNVKILCATYIVLIFKVVYVVFFMNGSPYVVKFSKFYVDFLCKTRVCIGGIGLLNS